jgi:hypothetical protein
MNEAEKPVVHTAWPTVGTAKKGIAPWTSNMNIAAADKIATFLQFDSK